MRDPRHAPPRPPSPIPWRVACGVFLATAAADALLAAGPGGAGGPPGWMSVAVALGASLCALAALAQRLPWQNVFAVAFIVVFFAGAAGLCGAVSGIPFGAVEYTERAEPKLFEKLPAMLPLWWLAIVVASREAGRLAVLPLRRHRNYGLFILAAAALLVVALDLSLEAFGVKVHGAWQWRAATPAPAWPAAPAVNFAGWAITALIMLAFCGPWLITKRPIQPRPVAHGALAWGLLNGYLALRLALAGLWLDAAVGLAAILVVSALAWRGLRFARAGARPPEPREPDDDNPAASPS